MKAIHNENLELRNSASTLSTGSEAVLVFGADEPLFHDALCECHGLGYFVATNAVYDGCHQFRAPEGRVLLIYCGLSDAISDDEIVAAYGMKRDLDYEIDKWGVIVVEPRPAHKLILEAVK